MNISVKTKDDFSRKRQELFTSYNPKTDPLRFSMEYSLLVEEFIRRLAGRKKYNFVVASAGSFSRRELSPFSDIDIMFINQSIDENESDISELVKILWDNGIEISHTVRDFNDLQKFLVTDLHTFTQFFETRFLIGSEKIYNQWNELLFSFLNEDISKKLITDLFEDIRLRYSKYGDSPKMLEPNVKLSAGGLRDFQSIEWIFILKHKTLLNKQAELTQAEVFIDQLKEFKYTTPNECMRLLNSYRFILGIRNQLHLFTSQKTDRLEFENQIKLAGLFNHVIDTPETFMKMYFESANVINRFSKSMIKKFTEKISSPIPDSLSIELDEDFIIKGKTIFYTSTKELTLSDILRAFYYRGLYSAHFDENLRSLIVERTDQYKSARHHDAESSVFFREIIKLNKNIGQTLSVMNELGALGAFLPEFRDLAGFMQHGVYHCYTADEHTLTTIKNVELLEKDTGPLGKIYNNLKNKETLFLGLLFHDIAKPINISGHEIIGAELAESIMHKLGYSDREIDQVTFLVKNHLLMEQVAFRRNLNDPETLNNFTAKFSSIEDLDLLYLVTYADLSAVNPAVWTSWKSELLAELYRKSRAMLADQITGEELLISSTYIIPKEVIKHSDSISESHVQEHMDSINDIGYAHHFTDVEIAQHIEEIQRGITISVLFKDLSDFTNVTVITKDYPALLSKLCGVFSINDANIHDAKIFTRKDGIVIDTFNVTDFRSHKKLDESRYDKIKNDLDAVVAGRLQLNQEFAKLKSKWWRIENKFFKRSGKVKVMFEKHEKYTIIDVFSPDRLGFLYQVTHKMNELGLSIYFAKISTKGDDIVDSFYVLSSLGKKISPNDYELVKAELTKTIEQIL